MGGVSVSVADLQNSLTEWAGEVFVEATGILQEELVTVAPVGETGEVRDSITANIGSVGIVNTGSVEAASDHASFTNDGTSPHQIDGSPLLAFQFAGQTVIVHSVQHPGNAATHWWDNSADDAHWLAACSAAMDAVPLV